MYSYASSYLFVPVCSFVCLFCNPDISHEERHLFEVLNNKFRSLLLPFVGVVLWERLGRTSWTFAGLRWSLTLCAFWRTPFTGAT